MKVYIVIELTNDVPKIVDVFYNKSDAEHKAYERSDVWRNIIEKEVK